MRRQLGSGGVHMEMDDIAEAKRRTRPALICCGVLVAVFVVLAVIVQALRHLRRGECSTHDGRGPTPPSAVAPPCRRLNTGGCERRRGTCVYQVAYGDLATGRSPSRGAQGCRASQSGVGTTSLFLAAAGLLGLGRGRLSLPTQTARRYGRLFSYCLVDCTSSNRPSATPPRSSTLTFGAGAVPGHASFTPMVSNPRMATFYYVRVVGFSVGGARVRGVGEQSLRLDPATGRGGVVLDSGTSVTRLARPVYVAVRGAFRKAAMAAGGLGWPPAGSRYSTRATTCAGGLW